MKKLVLALTCLFAVFISVSVKKVMADSAIAEAPLNGLFNSYLAVKDALAGDNFEAARQHAQLFLTAFKQTGVDKVPAAEQKQLNAAAEQLAGAKDISGQREAFAAISPSLYRLAKADPVSGEPLYYQYCLMKKAYWLSSSAAIKNPYYGKQMSTCGKVTDTLKK